MIIKLTSYIFFIKNEGKKFQYAREIIRVLHGRKMKKKKKKKKREKKKERGRGILGKKRQVSRPNPNHRKYPKFNKSRAIRLITFFPALPPPGLCHFYFFLKFPIFHFFLQIFLCFLTGMHLWLIPATSNACDSS